MAIIFYSKIKAAKTKTSTRDRNINFNPSNKYLKKCHEKDYLSLLQFSEFKESFDRT